MGDDGLIVAQSAGDQGGGHLLAAVFASRVQVVHGGVGVLDEARQKADEHGARLGLGEFFGEDGDGSGRGNFAQIHAAYAVGNGEKIAVGAGLVARGGDERTHRVFIVGADFAEVACLAEL